MTEDRLQQLVSIRDLTRESATRILETADTFLAVTRRPIRKVPTLRPEQSLHEALSELMRHGPGLPVCEPSTETPR